MAYLNWLAAVAEPDLQALRCHERSEPIEPSRTLGCSHLLAYWITEQPIGALLGEALDGGDEVDPRYSHPMRVPLFRSAEATQRFATRLRAGWNETLRTHEAAREYWFRLEVDPLVEFFEFAAARAEAVVSALEPPHDEERAELVDLPIVVSADRQRVLPWDHWSPSPPQSP